MRIRELRRERNMTQAELAKLAGMAAPNLSVLERLGDSASPKVFNLKRLSRALGVTLDELCAPGTGVGA